MPIIVQFGAFLNVAGYPDVPAARQLLYALLWQAVVFVLGSQVSVALCAVTPTAHAYSD
jgi:hypothetical protein